MESSSITGIRIPTKEYLIKIILDGIFKPVSDDLLSPSLDGIFKPISDDLLSSSPNGIYKPIPNITYTVKYRFRLMQIYGHSSVQSSSTFRSRKADQPIYILRFKKIEQGQLLYPKIFPLILLITYSLKSLTCSRMPKS